MHSDAAAEAVRTTTRRITRIITKQDLLKIEGVGESTAEKILHYIQSLRPFFPLSLLPFPCYC